MATFGGVNWGDGSFANPPTILSFTSSATGAVDPSTSVTLSWTLGGATATSVSIDQGVGDVTGTSSTSVAPAVTTTYTLTATAADASTATASVTIAVTSSSPHGPPGPGPQIASFTASATGAVPSGTSVTLSWTLSGETPTSLSIDQGIGSVLGESSVAVSPTQTTTYTITATNSDGSNSASLTVVVSGSPSSSNLPFISSFTASATTSTPGTPVTLSWTVTNADNLYLQPDIGQISGTSTTVTPVTTTTYTLEATNAYGAVTATVTIIVRGSSSENIRYHQIRRNERHGDSTWIQMSDGTGIDGHVAVYDLGGNVTDGGAFPVTSSGPGETPADRWYGQVPRGTRDGVTTTFQLDFTVTNPHTILHLNGSVVEPVQDGSGTDPEGFYTVDMTGGAITLAFAPLSTDQQFHIWYWAGDPIQPPAPPTPSPITAWDLIVTTAFTNNALGTSASNVSQWGSTSFAFGDGPFLSDASSYASRTDTLDLTNATYQGILFNADTTAEQLAAYKVTFWSATYPNATGLETLLEQASFSIYDCYLQATHADSSTTVYRPTSQVVTDNLGLGGAGFPVCDNPAFAIDSDNTTCAVLHNHAIFGIFWDLSNPNTMDISGFTAVS